MKKSLNDIMYRIYCEMYDNSEPKADFQSLIDNAEIDEDGRKIIPYNNYTIDEDVMDAIIEANIKANRLKPEERKIIKINAYLGCSPITTHNANK